MVRVEFLVQTRWGGRVVAPGDRESVDAGVAERWVRNSIAAAVDAPKPTIKIEATGGGYYNLVRNGEVVERVRGRLAAEARVTELSGG